MAATVVIFIFFNMYTMYLYTKLMCVRFRCATFYYSAAINTRGALRKQCGCLVFIIRAPKDIVQNIVYVKIANPINSIQSKCVEREIN